jgi:hypothetical protein
MRAIAACGVRRREQRCAGCKSFCMSFFYKNKKLVGLAGVIIQTVCESSFSLLASCISELLAVGSLRPELERFEAHVIMELLQVHIGAMIAL